MGSEEEFFNKIICVDKGYSDSESGDESQRGVDNIKENTKRITTAQVEKLKLNMEGRSDGFTKGKMKSTEESMMLLEKWNQLASELNAIGPPEHTTSKWRRIWTKMKSRKSKCSSSSVLLPRNENKKVKYRHRASPISNQFNVKSNVTCENIQDVTGENGATIGDQVESESEHILNGDEVQVKSNLPVEDLLSRMAESIASIGKQQAVANETINNKMDLILKQQSNINYKLNLLASQAGVDFVDSDTEHLRHSMLRNRYPRRLTII